MSTRIYTGVNPFNFIRKHLLQICLFLSAQRLFRTHSIYDSHQNSALFPSDLPRSMNILFSPFLFDCPLEWCVSRFIDPGSILQQSIRDLWKGKMLIWAGSSLALRVYRVSNLSIHSPYLFVHCPGDSSRPTGGSISTKAYSHPPQFIRIGLLTFLCRNYFFNFSTPCV